MKFRFFSILLALLLSSCATVFNHKDYKMNVCSAQANSSLSVYDTVYQLPAKIKIQRSVKDLPIVLKTDSIEKKFILVASPNRMTIFGNLPYLYLMPVAYAVDHYTNKRYYYGQNIILDVNDSVTVLNKGFFPGLRHQIHDYFQKPYPGKKGQINIIVGSPLQNNLYMENDYGSKDYNFWGGVKIGLEYFYSDHQFLSLTASHVRGIVAKNGSDGKDNGGYVDPYSTSFELKNNYGHKRFAFGYGLSYSMNDLTRVTENEIRFAQENPSERRFEYHNYMLGLSMSSHFRVYDRIFLGVNYRPNLLLLENNSTRFHYDHLISLELLFKLRVKK